MGYHLPAAKHAILKFTVQDSRVAQPVTRPTLDLGFWLDLRVVSSNPVLGSMGGHGAYFKKKTKTKNSPV